MKPSNKIKYFTLALCSSLCATPAFAAGDDIDIFTGASGGDAIKPRILIILDNTSNWSRNNQHWQPSGTTQGQAEAEAISEVLTSMNDSISVGLMEFNTSSPNTDGGFIRAAVKEMNTDNKNNFQSTLATIAGNVTGPNEKGASNAGYGNIMRDAYNYFAGGNSLFPASVDKSKSDNDGYVTDASVFRSPLTATNTCGKTFIIFIGNSGTLNADDSTNTAALNALNPGRTVINNVPKFNTTTVTTSDTAGITAACYADKDAAAAGLLVEPIKTECSFYSQGCVIDQMVTKSPDTCASGTSAYSVLGTHSVLTNVPVAGTVATTSMNSDDWALFMAEKGIPVNGTTIRPTVTTYTIDVYKDQGNAEFTGIMMSMAKAGRGKYFLATTKKAIKDALETITSEIQAVNSAFASTSLPVNATNRSQNQNQVFIGMFRPDAQRRPRWFGNLKKYQLIFTGGGIDLGDALKQPAVNGNTGFMSPCAQSFWSKDSGQYWNIDVGLVPPYGEPVKGNCLANTGYSLYSDLPDGELVEKGAAAQMMRQGNSTSAASDSRAMNRTVKTLVGSSLVDFSTAAAPGNALNADLVNWIRGSDIDNEKHAAAPVPTAAERIDLTRPSMHGDVIHSRPLPVTYGAEGTGAGATPEAVIVYYGANDGALHAVDAATGLEKWAFVEPDSAARMARMKKNTPLVSFSGQSPAHAAVATPKDYFFDGSIGLYQNAADAAVKKIWIYPAMRRGGRRIYALDVTNRNTPQFKWRLGCYEVGDEDVCDAGMEEMGQSWSTPNPAFIRGFHVAKAATTSPAAAAVEAIPAVVYGGGYDKCEDTDARITTQCAATKGKAVYIRRSDTGANIASFTPATSGTSRAFAADISMVDIDSDGYVDYAYAADTGGGLWRINFINNPTDKTVLEPAAWKMVKVAQSTNADGRKFLFPPALLYTAKKVYIAIGSGDREHPLESQYPYQTEVKNRFYVFKDDLSVAAPSIQSLDALPNALTATCATIGATPDATAKGWFLDLENGRGEQTVTSALIAGGMVAFSTNRPHGGETGTCATTLGHAHGYWLNLFTGSGAITPTGTCGGSRSAEFAGGGLPPSPVLATSVPIYRDKIGGGTETVPEYVSVVIGAVQKTGIGANAPFKPVPIVPNLNKKRKRTYTYSSSD